MTAECILTYNTQSITFQLTMIDFQVLATFTFLESGLFHHNVLSLDMIRFNLFLSRGFF